MLDNASRPLHGTGRPVLHVAGAGAGRRQACCSGSMLCRAARQLLHRAALSQPSAAAVRTPLLAAHRCIKPAEAAATTYNGIHGSGLVVAASVDMQSAMHPKKQFEPKHTHVSSPGRKSPAASSSTPSSTRDPASSHAGAAGALGSSTYSCLMACTSTGGWVQVVHDTAHALPQLAFL